MRNLIVLAVLAVSLTAVGCRPRSGAVSGLPQRTGPGGGKLPALAPLAGTEAPPLDEAPLRALLAEAGLDPATLTRLREDEGAVTWAVRVPGGEPALQAWSKLRDLVPRSGRWPVLVTAEALANNEGTWSEDCQAKAVLEAATKLDGAAELARRRAEDPEYYQVADGQWQGETAHLFTAPFDVLTGEPLPEMALALLPTSRPWEAAAHLCFGGFNACPPPELHVALHRSWHARHGAELVAMTWDLVEMRVARPAAKAEARALALEQFTYCADIVHQGVGDLLPLAATLDGATTWYFWWD